MGRSKYLRIEDARFELGSAQKYYESDWDVLPRR